jgi:hypothetical protein
MSHRLRTVSPPLPPPPLLTLSRRLSEPLGSIGLGEPEGLRKESSFTFPRVGLMQLNAALPSGMIAWHPSCEAKYLQIRRGP